MAHDSHEAHAKAHAGKLKEQRFVAEPTGRANFQALIGGLGVAALGAGTYATWMHDVPMPIAPYLFGGGTLAVVIASVMGSADATPIRVGDIGIALDRGGDQPERIPWFEIESVTLEDKNRLVVTSKGKRVVAPASHHAAAAAWILKEAMDRIPKRVNVPADRTAELLRAVDEHGTEVTVEPLQLAGRRCKATNAIISFERDARTCKRCGEVYDKKHVPPTCLTCEAPMTEG